MAPAQRDVQQRKGEKTIRNNVAGLVLWVLASLAAGWLGSNFRPGDWYASLAKPSWNPPSSVFAPVWTTLYVLMGVAAWLVWREAGFSRARVALSLFVVQLVLNSLWSYLFFGLQKPMIAYIEIIVLWCAILATLVSFWKVRPSAGALLIPYLLWVSFAAALNYQLWRLNA